MVISAFNEYCIWSSYVPHERIIESTDGKVKDKEDPILKLAKDLQIKLVGNDGRPVRGADVELQCNTSKKIQSGIEQSDGTYIFENAIPASGKDECELIVKKEG